MRRNKDSPIVPRLGTLGESPPEGPQKTKRAPGRKAAGRRGKQGCRNKKAGRSGHLEAELMALVAEDLGGLVPVMAVRAVELVPVVRRRVRIGRLDVLRLLNERLRRMALRARRERGLLRVLRVGAVARGALHALGGVAVGKELAALIGGRGAARGKQEGERGSKGCGYMLHRNAFHARGYRGPAPERLEKRFGP